MASRLFIWEDGMDVFTDIVDTLRVHGVIYFHTNFIVPWGLRVPTYRKVARFHLVTGGVCWVRLDQVAEPVRVDEGDLILIPHGGAHVLSDSPDRPALLVDDVIQRTGYNGRGAFVYSAGEKPDSREAAHTTMVCGHFEFDDQFMHPLLTNLPHYILIRSSQTLIHTWLGDAVRFISREIENDLSGAEAVVKRLSEILFIQVARAYLAEAGDGMRFIAALKDTSLAKALAAMHGQPGKRWTVEELADVAGASRARFAAKFQAMVGQPPIEYLTQWRMLKAAQMLRQSMHPVKTIAMDLGYQSVQSFTRAFNSYMQVSPYGYRDQYS